MAESGNVASALGAVSLFSELSADELRLLAVRAVRKRFAEGELLFSEGDACRGLHIVASGKLRIFKSSPSGREQVLAVEGPGGSVAELPVFDGGPYPASVSAVEDSQILFISRDDFRRFCLEHPEVALKMLAVEPVGNYAIRINWSDGHSSGIYSYEHFREICQCRECTGSDQSHER